MQTARTQRWRDRSQTPRGRCHPYPRTGGALRQGASLRLSVGLFANGKGGSSQLVRVCVFSHPINNASVPKTAGLLDPRADWLADLERAGFLHRRRHPGCHTYLFPLTKAARIAARKVSSLPYPVLDRTASQGDVTALPLLALAAGSTWPAARLET